MGGGEGREGEEGEGKKEGGKEGRKGGREEGRKAGKKEKSRKRWKTENFGLFLRCKLHLERGREGILKEGECLSRIGAVDIPVTVHV